MSNYVSYYDYPKQKESKKEREKQLSVLYKKNLTKEERKRQSDIIRNNLNIEYDVYSQIVSHNNFPSFKKLYGNFENNRSNFHLLLKLILNHYSEDKFETNGKGIDLVEKITAIQLYNPNQGKGLNALKANNKIKNDNINSFWISETTKISGAFSDMICQLVKKDLKVFVPEYKQVNYGFKSNLILAFKKSLKGNTPIKIDVLNILSLTQKILERGEFMGRRKRVKDIVSGFHSVYQKSMGKSKSVINIGFIGIPAFIKVENKEDVQDWIKILEDQRKKNRRVGRNKGAALGLKLYRDFISSSDIQRFFEFSFWYTAYLTS